MGSLPWSEGVADRFMAWPGGGGWVFVPAIYVLYPARALSLLFVWTGPGGSQQYRYVCGGLKHGSGVWLNCHQAGWFPLESRTRHDGFLESPTQPDKVPVYGRLTQTKFLRFFMNNYPFTVVGTKWRAHSVRYVHRRPHIIPKFQCLPPSFSL